MSALDSPADYEARLVAFLGDQRQCNFASLPQLCPWSQGGPGVYSRFVRDRPHLFTLESIGGHCVLSLAPPAATSPPVPRPPPTCTEQEYETALAAYLARRGHTFATTIECNLPLPACVPLLLPFLASRPHRFAVQMAGTKFFVDLRPGGHEGARPPRAPPTGLGGCLVCGIVCFTSTLHRSEHEAGRPHLVRVAKSLLVPKEGVSLSGPAQLASAPGSTVTVSLVLQNHGAKNCTLRKLWLLRRRRDVTLVSSMIGHAVPTGSAATLQLLHKPSERCVARVMVICSLVAPDGTCFSVGKEVMLRCTASTDDPELQPKSPFVRPKRLHHVEELILIPGEPLRVVSQRARLAQVEIPKALSVALTASADDPRRKALEEELAPPLSLANHHERFKKLLLCEEIQQQIDIRMYDMTGVQFEKQNSRPDRPPPALWLYVPGLAEARPSVMRGDKVAIGQYAGVVHGVQLECVALRFHRDFHARHIDGKRYDVRFVLKRTPMLLMHAALQPPRGELACCPAALLFPPPFASEAVSLAAAAVVLAAELPHLPLYNRQLNARQLQAVRGALSAKLPAASAPYIIFGPPGTGKTSTVVEYVLQLLTPARKPGSSVRPNMPRGGTPSPGLVAGLFSMLSLRSPAQMPPPELMVLVTAPSNTAVDIVVSRLLRGGLLPSQILRANAYQRPKADVLPELLPCCTWSEIDHAFLLPPDRNAYAGKWVVAATCSTAQKLARVPGCAGLFSHIVMDEAGQATEPEALCAVAGLLHPEAAGGGRLVLAGDPKQLGPVLRSALASKAGLGTSFLERLLDFTPSGPHASSTSPGTIEGFHPAFVTLLTNNYRSHRQLISVSSSAFYDNKLVACADPARSNAFCNWAGLPEGALAQPGGFPLLFHGIEGKDEREGNSPSWFNAVEAQVVLDHVRSVLDHRGGGITQDDVGVVTPYHKQALKIRSLLKKNGFPFVTVGSVEKFQGGERAVIILSAVRSAQEHVAFDAKHALGFLSNPKRFNVAITRARALLVIVGNPAVLGRDRHWGDLLRHAIKHGGYTGCALPPGFGDGDEEEDVEAELRRIAEEEEARAEAAMRAGDGAEDDVRAAEEGPAWRNEA